MSTSGLSFDLRLIFLPPGYCNYQCPFCHEEGVIAARRSTTGPPFPPREVCDLVLWLKPSGLRGVTFSGGEPLLWVDALVAIAEELPPLPLTIVTNGTRLSTLASHVERLPQFKWRLNINFPSFDPLLFSALTGQSRFKPTHILAALPALLRLGVEVNFNCVLCPGQNDDPEVIGSFAAKALRLGVSNVRFLLQSGTEVLSGKAEFTFPPFGYTPSVRRGGRIMRYDLRGGRSIEVVRCESELPPNGDPYPGQADIYVTTRRTVKFGLRGSEHYFTGFESLRGLLRGWLDTFSVDAQVKPELPPQTDVGSSYND